MSKKKKTIIIISSIITTIVLIIILFLIIIPMIKKRKMNCDVKYLKNDSGLVKYKLTCGSKAKMISVRYVLDDGDEVIKLGDALEGTFKLEPKTAKKIRFVYIYDNNSDDYITGVLEKKLN